MTQPPPTRTRAVFFDVGDTLVHVHPSVGEVYARVAGSHGARVDGSAVQASFDAAWEEMRSRVPKGANRYRHFPGGELGWWRKIVGRSFEGSGFDPLPHFEEFFELFSGTEVWRPFPDTLSALDRLSARGLRLGVISNWDSRLPALLQALGLRRYFSLVLCSSAEDMEKPAPEIFRRAARRCGVEPAGALHVGDRLEEDYDGARSAGMRAVLIDRSRRAGGRATEVIADLTEIEGLL